MQVLSRKFSIALLSIFIFSFILTLISITTSQQYDLPFSTLWLTFCVLSAPMFLIIGILSSFVYGKYVHTPLVRLGCYVLTGAILILPYANFYFQGSNTLQFAFMGACGAMLFFAIEWLFFRFIVKEAL